MTADTSDRTTVHEWAKRIGVSERTLSRLVGCYKEALKAPRPRCSEENSTPERALPLALVEPHCYGELPRPL